MSEELKEQYEKIFRYCFFKVHDREAAEDITQETFLRFLESPNYTDMNKELRYLYTIAGNLCADHFRRKPADELSEDIPDESDFEDCILNSAALGTAIRSLPQEDRELVVLRYINETPVSVRAELYGVSRFKMGRRIKVILDELRKQFKG